MWKGKGCCEATVCNTVGAVAKSTRLSGGASMTMARFDCAVHRGTDLVC